MKIYSFSKREKMELENYLALLQMYDVFIKRYIIDVVCQRLSIDFTKNNINYDLTKGILNCEPKDSVQPVNQDKPSQGGDQPVA
ncbi:MAG TPA: hypothetical protein ACFYD4_06180 [Candidatus Wunengus sp. YC61]|uniref:hypothetical protein n=1 Tax=Candidatus Wunengus sp. YC61 TaxID=3367698 RepID=UPI00402886A6